MVTESTTSVRTYLLLRDNIREQLSHSPFVALRRLTFRISQGILILNGRVPTFYTKQVALSLASTIEGVEMVIDEIQVGMQTDPKMIRSSTRRAVP